VQRFDAIQFVGSISEGCAAIAQGGADAGSAKRLDPLDAQVWSRNEAVQARGGLRPRHVRRDVEREDLAFESPGKRRP
jgi:hypothetical protein